MEQPKTKTVVVVEEPLKSMLEEAEPHVVRIQQILEREGYAPDNTTVIALLWLAANVVTHRDVPLPKSAFLMMAGVVHHVEQAQARGEQLAAIKVTREEVS